MNLATSAWCIIVGVATSIGYIHSMGVANAAPVVEDTLTKSFQLSVQVQEEVLRTGQPVVLQLALRNKTERDIDLTGTGQPYKDFLFEVKDSKGNLAPLTAYARNLRVAPLFRIVNTTLKAGEEARYKVVINAVIDMTRSDDYSVVVKRDIPGPFEPIGPGKTEVVSNAVRVKVIPEAVPPLEIIRAEPKAPTATGSDVSAVFSSRWKEGDFWDLAVEAYHIEDGDVQNSVTAPNAQQAKSLLIGAYRVRATVVGVERLQTKDYWQVDFRPNDQAPLGVGGQAFRVLVGKDDGLAYRVIDLKGEQNPPVVSVDGVPVARAPFGFPLAFFSMSKDRTDVASPTKTWHLVVEGGNAALGHQVSATISMQSNGKEILRQKITQQWASNAKWWSSYELTTNGQREMHAVLLPSSTTK